MNAGRWGSGKNECVSIRRRVKWLTTYIDEHSQLGEVYKSGDAKLGSTGRTVEE